MHLKRYIFTTRAAKWVVFSGVLLWVSWCVGYARLFVNTLKPFEIKISSWIFYGNKVWSKARIIGKRLHSDTPRRAGSDVTSLMF